MNKLPSYAVQYGKILDAYMKDEIRPFDAKFCFCGTLADVNRGHSISHSCAWVTNEYTRNELIAMEKALLSTIQTETNARGGIFDSDYYDVIENKYLNKSNHPNYENALFNGMSAALDVLKEIHEAHGEIIDAAPVLLIRSLQLI